MTQTLEQLRRAADAGFAILDIEVSEARQRDLRSVVTQSATGTGNIDETFGLDQRYRLVFVRCHFAGTAGTDALTIAVDSGTGTAYDTALLFFEKL